MRYLDRQPIVEMKRLARRNYRLRQVDVKARIDSSNPKAIGLTNELRSDRERRCVSTMNQSPAPRRPSYRWVRADRGYSCLAAVRLDGGASVHTQGRHCGQS